MRTHKTALIALTALALTGACYKSPTNPQGSVPTSVRLTVGTNTLAVGQSTSATATALDYYGMPYTAGTPAFTSSAPEVARVDPATGVIQAIAPGTTTITATINGTSAKQTVTVTAPAGGDGETAEQRQWRCSSGS